MDGHIIAFKEDANNTSITYWDGTNGISDLDQSLFISDIVTARQTAGTLQTQYTDREVIILAASKGVQLKTPLTVPSTPNYPTAT